MDTNRTQTLPSIRAIFPDHFPPQPPQAGPPSSDDIVEPDLPIHHTSNTITSLKKNYACETCGRRFRRPSHLAVHVRSHTGERPYLCTHPGCGKRFQTKSNLKRHSFGHEGVGIEVSGGDDMDSRTIHEPENIDERRYGTPLEDVIEVPS